ncbi:hypothetical protein ACS0TY_007539 [Phlomoides rotata]
MAKLRTFGILAFVALFSVEMTVIRGNEVMKECYEIHHEIICEGGSTVKCSDFCKKKFGPSTTVQCFENLGVDGPFCVCNAC